MTMLLRTPFAAALTSALLFAQTTVSGHQSGTWDASGSPYLVAADVTVPTGQVLIIEAGTEVRFFAGTSLFVDGQIVARGTESRRVRFIELVAAQPWGEIRVTARGINPPRSTFAFCDFRGGSNCLHAYSRGVADGWTAMTVAVTDCTFANCDRAFKGQALGWNHYTYGVPHRRHGRLDPVIERCRFDGVEVAIDLTCLGSCSVWCGAAAIDVTVKNNLFHDVTNVMTMIQNGAASGLFAGNTVVDCDQCIQAGGQFSVEIVNNIFAGCGTALDVTSSSSVSYNAFYNNTTDCQGCLVSFGALVWANRNSHPSDLNFNLFADPQFVDPAQHDYRLSPSSPGREAGHPSIAAVGLDIHSDPRTLDSDGDGVAWSDLGFDEGNLATYSVSGSATVGSTLVHAVDAPPGWAFFVGAGFVPADLPAGELGAVLLAGPIVLFANGTTPGSVASVIPNSPQFVGLDVFFQAAAVSPALSPATLSRRVGVRLH